MKRLIQGLLSATVGEQRFQQWLGSWDYTLHREVKTGFGGPLNGSATRAAVFQELLRRRAITAIVETGTFRGLTTEYFADTGVPVHTSESNPRFWAYARAKLRLRPNVQVFLGDSRQLLRQLIQDPAMPKDRVFFYLDAHWEKDLPLREEVDLIFRNWTRAIVMVDDFQVPDDPGYKFDDYGEGMRLALAYLEPVANLGISAFFPKLPGSQESGLKRGWAVLAADPAAIGELSQIELLRPWMKAFAG